LVLDRLFILFSAIYDSDTLSSQSSPHFLAESDGVEEDNDRQLTFLEEVHESCGNHLSSLTSIMLDQWQFVEVLTLYDFEVEFSEDLA
jgi:hypothetical protein